ncbi:MAG: hypothetical protein F4Z74_08160 [Acidobacteria bacterium]|nr:hypothetical protein [Acidobacteriota bacterium]
MKNHRNTVLPVLIVAALLLPAMAPAQTDEPEPWWAAALAPVPRYVPAPPPVLGYVPEPSPVPWLPGPFPGSESQAERRWECAHGCETAHYAGVVLMDEAARLTDLARWRDVKLLEPAPLSGPTLTQLPVFDPVSRLQRRAASALESSALMLWHHWQSPPCTGR